MSSVSQSGKQQVCFFFRSRNGTWSQRRRVLTPVVAATAFISLTVWFQRFTVLLFPTNILHRKRCHSPAEAFQGREARGKANTTHRIIWRKMEKCWKYPAGKQCGGGVEWDGEHRGQEGQMLERTNGIYPGPSRFDWQVLVLLTTCAHYIMKFKIMGFLYKCSYLCCYIFPCIILIAFLLGSWECLNLSQLGQRPEQVCHRADIKGQTNIHTHVHIYGQFRVANEPYMHVFGWWEAAREPGEDPRHHMGRTCLLEH